MSEIKVGLCGQMFPPAEHAVKSITRAEDLGWDFINFPDQLTGTHPFGMLKSPVTQADPSAPSGMYSDVWFSSFEICAAAAVLTENIDILLAVVDPLRRSPALMAQEMATLNHLSRGRLTFALGAGEAKQFEPYGEKRVKPQSKLEEAVHTFKALWGSEGRPVSRLSPFWPLDDAVFPLPRFGGRDPQILLVGGSDRILSLTGEVCDGWLTFLPGGSMDDPELMAQMINAVKAAAGAAGRDPSELRFVAQVFAAIGHTDDEAWERAQLLPVKWLGIIGASIAGGAAWKKYGYEHPFGDYNWATASWDLTRMTIHEAERLSREVPDEILDHSCLWGSPKHVAERLKPYIEAGITEFSLFNFSAAADPSHAIGWDELCSEVRTHLGCAPLNFTPK
jgi:phthiodiolone/phenolphthiodiolone dimycocerosates ketoreductase